MTATGSCGALVKFRGTLEAFRREIVKRHLYRIERLRVRAKPLDGRPVPTLAQTEKAQPRPRQAVELREHRVEMRPRDQFLRTSRHAPSLLTTGHREHLYLRPRSLIGTWKKPRWPFTGCGSMRSINVKTQAIAPPSGRLRMAARSSATVIGRQSTRFTTAIAYPAGGTSGRLLETISSGPPVRDQIRKRLLHRKSLQDLSPRGRSLQPLPQSWRNTDLVALVRH